MIKDIHDIQPPIKLSYNFFPLILIIILLVIIIILFIYFFKFRNKSVLENKIAKVLTPASVALHELDKIKIDKLIENNKCDLFYDRITNIMKKYLFEKYGFISSTKTSIEILNQVKLVENNIDVIRKIELCLYDYDFSKYSSYTTSIKDMNSSFELTYNFFQSEK